MAERNRPPGLRLEVALANDDGPGLLLDDLPLFHVGCGQMRTRRNPASDERSITCACGLDIELTGDREQCILRAAVSGTAQSFGMNGTTVVIAVRERESK